MKVCKACGRILQNNCSFCGVCGKSEFEPLPEGTNMPVPTPIPTPKPAFSKFDLLTVLGFVAAVVGFFQVALILEPLGLICSLIGFLKGNRSKGLAVAGVIISVIALLLKLFDTLWQNGLIPEWLFAGTFH